MTYEAPESYPADITQISPTHRFSTFLIWPLFSTTYEIFEIPVGMSRFEVLNEHLFLWLSNDIKTIVVNRHYTELWEKNA